MLAALALLAHSPSVEGQTWVANAASSAKSAAIEHLVARAQQEGRLRVILGVELAGGFQPEGMLEAAQAQDQRLRVAAAQGVLTEAVRGGGGDVHASFETIPFVVAEVDAATLQALVESGAVTSVEEDKLSEPFLAESVGLIGGTTAWNAGFTGQGQTVAVLDTGVDKSHPFLAGRVVSEACYSSTTSSTQSLCPGGVSASTASGSGMHCSYVNAGCDHGTHVAGIVAGRDAGSGFSGVAKDAQVIAVQVFSYAPSTSKVTAFNSDIARGLERVYALRSSYNIASVNMSLGGGQSFSYCDSASPAVTSIINSLRSAGIAVVIASGNSSYKTSVSFPACISSAISVGASCDAGPDANACQTGVDGVASYSNIASFLSLVAPGSYITSSVPGGGFLTKDGTSMAAPHVAGAWALLKQKYPNISVTEGLALLRDNALTIADTRSGGSVTGLKSLDVSFLGGGGSYPVTVSKAGTGLGTVVSNPAGINCGTACSANFNARQKVTLTATADGDSEFTGWGGACSGTGACTVAATDARAVTATFLPIGGGISLGEAVDNVALSWTTGGSRSWHADTSVKYSGAASASSGAILDLQNTWIQTTVTGPGTLRYRWKVSSEWGYDFLSFSYDGYKQDGAISGNVDWALQEWSIPAGTHTLRWTYEKDEYLTSGSDAAWLDQVSFVPTAVTNYLLTVYKSGSGKGTVTGTPSGISCGSLCSASFAEGTSVTLTASPAAGSLFTGWSGACAGMGPCTVNMSAARSVTANFAIDSQLLSVTRTGTGSGSVTSEPAGISCGSTCTASYSSVTTVTLTATPSSGSTFAGWSGPCSGTGTCTVTMTGARTVTAAFALAAGGSPLATALDSPALTWTTGGAALWAPQTTHWQVGGSAAASGAIANWQSSYIQTTVNGPGRLRFRWKVSSEDGYDYLVFYYDGYEQDGAISGEVGWASQSWTIPSGVHTLRWSYEKDSSFASGLDRAWLDEVTFTPTGQEYTLRVTKAGSGDGTVTSSPPGINCGAACTANYGSGTLVELEASPGAGSLFTGWSGACSGRGTCEVTVGAAAAVEARFDSSSYYLAEGSTADPFDLDVVVANPNNQQAPVTLTFLTGSGLTESLQDTLPAHARRTYRVGRTHAPVLRSEGGVSTVVESRGGLPLIVERSMFWNKSTYHGGHGGTAVPRPERRWYFGEGAQGFFDTFVLLANSGNADANVTVSFLLDSPGAPPYVVPITVAAGRRETIWALAYPPLVDKSFSIAVESDLPIIAERAMYFGQRPIWYGGHESAGVPSLSTTWFHAEGATGDMFDEYILVGNPGDVPAVVTFTFLLDSGAPIVGTATIQARSRFTLNVEYADFFLAGIPASDAQRLRSAAVSVRVESTEPVVSERAMYWPGGPTRWTEAHNSFGITETGVKWGLAEGRSGGTLGFDTYILIANPSPQVAQVQVRFLLPNGATTTLNRTVPANSRFNIHPHEMPAGEFGAVVESTNRVPIVVERAMYWTPIGGPWWGGGTNALATKLQ